MVGYCAGTGPISEVPGFTGSGLKQPSTCFGSIKGRLTGQSASFWLARRHAVMLRGWKEGARGSSGHGRHSQALVALGRQEVEGLQAVGRKTT